MQEQVLLATEELRAVVGEALQLRRQARPGGGHLLHHVVEVEHSTLGDGLVVDVHRALVQPDLRAVLDRGQSAGADAVDELDSSLGQQLRTQVRIATGDERRGVDHCRHLGVGKRLCGCAVEVEVVDDGDVAGAQPGKQTLRSSFDARGCP